MKKPTAKLFAKAEAAIGAAESLLEGDHLEAGASRAYYAMFYTAEALLMERGLHFRRHGGVQSALGEHFVKTGDLDRKYHRWLLAAFSKRIVADYGVDADLSTRDVEEMVAQAREFLQIARQLPPNGP